MESKGWTDIVIKVIAIAIIAALAYYIGINSSQPVIETEYIYEEVVDTTMIHWQREELRRLNNLIDNYEPIIIKIPGETKIDTIVVYPLIKDSIVSDPYFFKFDNDKLEFSSKITSIMVYKLYKDKDDELYREHSQEIVVEDIRYKIMVKIEEPVITVRPITLFGYSNLGYGNDIDVLVGIQAIITEKYIITLQRSPQRTYIGIGYRIF